MVGAWQPQRGPAAHALEPRHDVLQRRKHGVAHVQLAGHVRRRHGDDVRLAACRLIGAEIATAFPPDNAIGFKDWRAQSQLAAYSF